MSNKTLDAAHAVTKWLEGGASTWGYPESQIRHLAEVAPLLLAALEGFNSRVIGYGASLDHRALSNAWGVADDAIIKAHGGA